MFHDRRPPYHDRMLIPPEQQLMPSQADREAFIAALAGAEAAIRARRREEATCSVSAWEVMLPVYKREALAVIAERGGDPDDDLGED